MAGKHYENFDFHVSRERRGFQGESDTTFSINISIAMYRT